MTVQPISEVIKNHPLNLQAVMDRYHIQVVHEDNDTYYIEDMKYKRSMTRGRIVAIYETQEQVINYLLNLRVA